MHPGAWLLVILGGPLTSDILEDQGWVFERKKSLLKCFYFNSDEENEKLDKGAKCGNNEPISFSVDNRFSFS